MKYAKGQFYIKFTKTIVDYKKSKTWIYQLFIKKSVTGLKYKSTTRVQLYKSTRKKWHNHSGHQQIDNWHSPSLYFSISFFQRNRHRIGEDQVQRSEAPMCQWTFVMWLFWLAFLAYIFALFDLALAQSQVCLAMFQVYL